MNNYIMPSGFCCQINSLIFPSFFGIEKYGVCNFGIMLAELNLPVGTNSIYYIFEDEAAAVVRASASHKCGLISNPSVDSMFWLSLLLVLSFAPRGFSPGTPVFPSSQKTNVSKFQFCQEW